MGACHKTPDKLRIKEGRWTLGHGVRGDSPWSLGPVGFGHEEAEQDGWRRWRSKAAPIRVERKARQRQEVAVHKISPASHAP